MTIINTGLGETAAASGATTGTDASAWATAASKAIGTTTGASTCGAARMPRTRRSSPARVGGRSAIGGVLYSWVIPDEPDTGGPRDHYRYIQLARSTDHAAHWTKPNWRWWREDNLIIPTFLVYGKDNAARAGRICLFVLHPPAEHERHACRFGLVVHKPGALFLARVPKDKLFAGRDAYEWFTGMKDGEPAWGPLAAKKPVFENPEGTGWCVSASYNPGLKRYLLATEHTVSHASVMSLFDAPEPWGPWTTVKYWTPNDRFGQTRPGSSSTGRTMSSSSRLPPSGSARTAAASRSSSRAAEKGRTTIP